LINSAKTKVYALFDDGSSDEIIFSYFGAPLRQNIPVRAYSNDIQDLDVQRSVIDGASGALANFEKNFESSGDRYCFAYKFLKDETNQAVTGKSAGFAFCLKFALKLYKNVINRDLDFSIAATGIIEIDEDTSYIKPVEKINHKLEATLIHLNSGDFFFYPLLNKGQIDQELQNKIIDKGIVVHAVETVHQAIKILFEGYIEKSIHKTRESSIKLRWILAASFSLIAALCIFYIFFDPTYSCYDEALRYLESGEFFMAKKISEDCLHNTENDSTQLILEQLNNELIITSNFIYIKNNLSHTAIQNKSSTLFLGMEDGYRFEVQSPRDCFLYILQFDSETSTEKLYPLSAFVLNQHFIQKNKLIQIPGGENMFYLNDRNHHGPVTIFIIASPWRLKDLENLFNNYEDNDNQNIKRNLYNKLLNRIKYYSQIRNSNIKSLFLRELTFIQA